MTRSQMTQIRKALAKLPQYPYGAMLDDIHHGVAKGVLSDDKYFGLKNSSKVVNTPNGKELDFSPIIKAWNERLVE